MTTEQKPRGISAFTMGIGPLLGAAFILSASNSLVFALMGNLQDEYGFTDAGLGFIAAAAFL